MLQLLDENAFDRHGLLKCRYHKHGELFSHYLFIIFIAYPYGVRLCQNLPKMTKAFRSTAQHFQDCSPFNESVGKENFRFQLECWKTFQAICWEYINLIRFFSLRALQLSSCCPSVRFSYNPRSDSQ